jgi:hypothetical protein
MRVSCKTEVLQKPYYTKNPFMGERRAPLHAAPKTVRSFQNYQLPAAQVNTWTGQISNFDFKKNMGGAVLPG